MSKTLNDWIKSFYPIEACHVKGSNKELLEHSLKKWKGATKENTEAYNCTYVDYIIVAKFNISDITNKSVWYLVLVMLHVLCAKYISTKNSETTMIATSV